MWRLEMLWANTKVRTLTVSWLTVVDKHKGKNIMLEHQAHIIFKTWARSCINCVPFLDVLSRLIRKSRSPQAVS